MRLVAAWLCSLAAAINRKQLRSISSDSPYLPDPSDVPDPSNVDSEVFSEALGLYKDLQYKEINGKPLALDIHMPHHFRTQKKIVPAMIYFHAGGWHSGKKEDIHGKVPKLLDEAIAVVTVNYRLVSEVNTWGGASTTWPAQGEDAADAVKWVKKYGSSYGIDTSRLGCWGESAGGQLCSWLASAGAMDESTRLNVAVIMFSPTCMLCWPYIPYTTKESNLRQLHSDFYFGFEKNSLSYLANHGDNLTTKQEEQVKLVQSAEAVHSVLHVSKNNTVPIFIGHGKKDTMVSYVKAQYLVKALSDVGASYEVNYIDDGGHFYQGWPDEPISNAISFVQKHMPSEAIDHSLPY